MTRDHQRVTDYLLAESAVLREQLRGRRIRYTDAQRCRLAAAAKKLGRKALKQLDTLATTDTLLHWYSRSVAAKYDSSARPSHGLARVFGRHRRARVRMATDAFKQDALIVLRPISFCCSFRKMLDNAA